MLALLGLVLLVGGAVATFAVERQVDGVDLQLVGWILMGAGGVTVAFAAVRAAVTEVAGSTTRPSGTRPSGGPPSVPSDRSDGPLHDRDPSRDHDPHRERQVA